MPTVMKRTKEKVNVGGFKFKLASDRTALGFIANNASVVHSGEFVKPPFIFDKAGKKRPLYAMYEKIKINEMLYMDVELAEKKYMQKVKDQVRKLTTYKSAFNEIVRLRTAETARRRVKNHHWEYTKYVGDSKFHNENTLSIHYECEKKRTKPKNLTAAMAYEKADIALGRATRLVNIYKDILERAIYHNLDKAFVAQAGQGLVVLIINKHDYIFERQYNHGNWRLCPYAFPSAYNSDVLRCKELKNNTAQWPFTDKHA